MKKVWMLVLLITTAGQSFALAPIQWKYSAKKIAAKTYEVSITATITKGWHVYAQKQPKEAIAQPTKVMFTKNPLIILNGSVKEVGRQELQQDEALGISQYVYSNKVTFIQLIQLKANVKTNISGTTTYQACNDEMCLPSAVMMFNIKLEG